MGVLEEFTERVNERGEQVFGEDPDPRDFVPDDPIHTAARGPFAIGPKVAERLGTGPQPAGASSLNEFLDSTAEQSSRTFDRVVEIEGGGGLTGIGVKLKAGLVLVALALLAVAFGQLFDIQLGD